MALVLDPHLRNQIKQLLIRWLITHLHNKVLEFVAINKPVFIGVNLLEELFAVFYLVSVHVLQNILLLHYIQNKVN